MPFITGRRLSDSSIFRGSAEGLIDIFHGQLMQRLPSKDKHNCRQERVLALSVPGAVPLRRAPARSCLDRQDHRKAIHQGDVGFARRSAPAERPTLRRKAVIRHHVGKRCLRRELRWWQDVSTCSQPRFRCADSEALVKLVGEPNQSTGKFCWYLCWTELPIFAGHLSGNKGIFRSLGFRLWAPSLFGPFR